jgi:hypothetical protein
VAIAFALARLAAMTAATLVFLPFGIGAEGMTTVAAFGSGHTFSSCLRAVLSSDSNIACPRSGHTRRKTQKQTRADSRTAGLASASDFLTIFSKRSEPPLLSMAGLARAP